MSERTTLQSRKEREKKPWLSEIYRKFGTPIGPLTKEPAFLSMNGRGVGTSMNDIRVLRQPEFRALTVEDAIRQMKPNEPRESITNPLMKPNHKINVSNRIGKKNTTKNIPSLRNHSNPTPVKQRPAPKRLGKGNTLRVKRSGPKRNV